jgi:hypothetical protein
MKLVLLAAIGLALAAGVAAAWSQADVTLSLRQYTNANKVRVLVWYGQVANGAAGEHVEVLARDCGTKPFYRIAETQTAAGGGWEIQSQSSEPPYGSVRWSGGQTYRARWGNELSNTITLRFPFTAVGVKKISARRAWKVFLNTGDKDWTGKVVELQRRNGGKWVRFKVAKLVRKPSFTLGAYNHETVFEVPARGLTLRILVPAKTAAPCSLSGASDSWRS